MKPQDIKSVNRRRRQAARLLMKDVPVAEISRRTGLSRTTVGQVRRALSLDEGVKSVDVAPRGRSVGVGLNLAAAYQEEMRELWTRSLPGACGLPQNLWSKQALAALAAQRYGVQLSPTSWRRYLAAWGLPRGVAADVQIDENDYISALLWISATFSEYVSLARSVRAGMMWLYLSNGPDDEPRRSARRGGLAIVAATARGDARWMMLAASPTQQDVQLFVRLLAAELARPLCLFLSPELHPLVRGLTAWAGREQTGLHVVAACNAAAGVASIRALKLE